MDEMKIDEVINSAQTPGNRGSKRKWTPAGLQLQLPRGCP